MISSEVVRRLELVEDASSRIVLVVIDGVGGLPHPKTGLTELETAHTPNLDRLAALGTTGMIEPVGPGITPGSGVAHLALFGFDPFKYAIGRGAIAAAGVGLEMTDLDVAARFNFAKVSSDGAVLDRRAGRLATEKNQGLCKLLREIEVTGVELIIEPVLDYRGVVIFRGDGLSDKVADTDRQAEGDDVFPNPVQTTSPEAKRTADIANKFIEAANKRLRADDVHAIVKFDDGNELGILTRGYAKKPKIESMLELYNFKKAGAIATYPDYRGVARLVGMEIIDTGHELEDEFETYKRCRNDYDFLFFHVKKTDSAGEYGNFDKKVEIIEHVDNLVPEFLEEPQPDVLAITADHSTPATFKAHSWHPIPILFSGKWCRRDAAKFFSELACSQGSLGRFPAAEVMLHALAHAERIVKYGA